MSYSVENRFLSHTCIEDLLLFQGKVLVGTKDSDLIEINEKTGASTTLMNGHGEGEMWGLATHPSTDRFVSASDDGTVRLWDIVSKVSDHY